VMANLVALHLKVRPERLPAPDILKRNRWLKDVLRRAGLDRVMIGSADLSWEEGFYQLHWHIAMWTTNPTKLSDKLKPLFPGVNAYDRPVVVSETRDLGFLPYKDKGIKLPDLLRRNRTHLPDRSTAGPRSDRAVGSGGDHQAQAAQCSGRWLAAAANCSLKTRIQIEAIDDPPGAYVQLGQVAQRSVGPVDHGDGSHHESIIERSGSSPWVKDVQ
jgi:hypothetical protein